MKIKDINKFNNMYVVGKNEKEFIENWNKFRMENLLWLIDENKENLYDKCIEKVKTLDEIKNIIKEINANTNAKVIFIDD